VDRRIGRKCEKGLKSEKGVKGDGWKDLKFNEILLFVQDDKDLIKKKVDILILKRIIGRIYIGYTL